MGLGRLAAIAEDEKPDVIVLFNDLWVIKAWYEEIENLHKAKLFKAVAYFPVDATGYTPDMVDFLGALDGVATYTKFGVDVLREAGLDRQVEIIPHGTDTESFYPVDKAKARALLDLPLDDFIVFNGNRNQPRKRIDITIRAFSLFAKDKPDAYLYLHMGLKDAGWAIMKLFGRECRKQGIDPEKRLILTSMERDNQQIPVDRLNLIYNACDVGVNTSLGEGWGLVSTEMAMLGIPQIVTDYAASSELFPSEFCVPVAQFYTDPDYNLERGFVDSDRVAQKLEMYYYERHLVSAIAEDVKSHLKQFTWDGAAKALLKLIQSCP